MGKAAEVYATQIAHVRRTPWRREFRHNSYLWSGDLARLEERSRRRGSWFTGRIEARDHLGDPTASLRSNVADFLALHDINLGDGTIELAAHPRAWGHCFNPISVFWCRRADGTPLATVVEVHNTYGDRHAYLVMPTAAAPNAEAGQVTKEMYVSPFHGVDGFYRVSAERDATSVSIAVELTGDSGARFSASLQGHAVAGHRVRAALAGPRDAVLIRLHGITLWLRRLPIQSRPIHRQEGVQS